MAFNKVMEKQILTLGVEMMRKTGIFLMLLFIMTSGVVSFAEGSLQNNETKSDTEHIIVFDDLDKIPYQSFSGNDSTETNTLYQYHLLTTTSIIQMHTAHCHPIRG